tara:strand:+ start:140 stop:373 length:234 start_codon:yes stop_codon:yes gene_type:complete
MNDKFGKDFFGGGLRIQTEVVNGVCPTCHNNGILVSLYENFYRCMNCGGDVEQKVNGVIKYIPMGNPDTTLVVEKDG